MDSIRLPIYHVGLVKDGNNTTKIAVLQKTCKGWIVCHCQCFLDNEQASIPKKYFTAKTSFSLQGSDVLVKSSSSTLKNKKNSLKVALANLGMSSALPWESLVILPKQTSVPHGETITTLWIAQKKTIQEQLISLEEKQLFPTTISCKSADLFFLAEQTFLKKLPSYFLVYSRSEETFCIYVKDRAVLLSRSFSNGSAKKNSEDIHATLQYIRETFPTTTPTTIHFAEGSEALRKALSQKQDTPLTPCSLAPPPYQVYWEEFGDAIASALHGASRQALTFPFNAPQATPKAHKHWLKRTTVLIGKLALISTFLVASSSMIKLKALSNHTKRLYLLACPEKPALPKSLTAAENLLTTIEANTPRVYPYYPTIPSNEQILKFLAALAQNCPSLKFSYFSYEMTNFPSEQNPKHPYTAEILLKGQGKPEEVSQFLTKVSRHPRLSNVSTAQKDTQVFELRFNLTSQEAS